MAELPETYALLSFPVKGIDLREELEGQPEGTTPVGVNVRGYEPGTMRLRGGARPGIGQYIPQQLPGAIQLLDVIVTTNPAAVGIGGGFQPQFPEATGPFAWWVNYSWTATGFNLTTRLVRATDLSRSAVLYQDTNLFGLASPGDFLNAGAGYQALVQVFDQNGNAVQVNGLSQNTQALGIYTGGSTRYLGTPQTAYNWAQTYTTVPASPTTYFVVVSLLDKLNNPVGGLDALGNPTGANLFVAFGEATDGSGKTRTVNVPGTGLVNITTTGTLARTTYTFCYYGLAWIRGYNNNGPSDYDGLAQDGVSWQISFAPQFGGSTNYGSNYYIPALNDAQNARTTHAPTNAQAQVYAFSNNVSGVATGDGFPVGSLTNDQTATVNNGYLATPGVLDGTNYLNQGGPPNPERVMHVQYQGGYLAASQQLTPRQIALLAEAK